MDDWHGRALRSLREFNYCNTNYVLLGLIVEKSCRRAVGPSLSGSLVRTPWHEGHIAPCQQSNTIPEPYSHGYLYGGSSYALLDAPYPADLQAAARAGTFKPNDDTDQHPSYATAAGGVSLLRMIWPPGCVRWLEALNADYLDVP